MIYWLIIFRVRRKIDPVPEKHSWSVWVKSTRSKLQQNKIKSRVLGMYSVICKNTRQQQQPRWRHDMETITAWLTIWEGNQPTTDGFPVTKPIMWSFGVLLVVSLKKLLPYGTNNWIAGDLRRRDIVVTISGSAGAINRHKKWKLSSQMLLQIITVLDSWQFKTYFIQLQYPLNVDLSVTRNRSQRSNSQSNYCCFSFLLVGRIARI